MKFRNLTWAGIFTLALGAAGMARANDKLFWSVGIASPGVTIGVASAPPAMYPVPVYVTAYPVAMAPRLSYHFAPPVYHAPPAWRHARFGHHGYAYGYAHGHGHGHRGGQRGHF
ncbi:MAG: hypothetical protein ACO24Y_00250 [Hylemonella sp.]